MTYRYECLSLTQVGELFGVSNQQVGKWLTSLGLRQGSKPSIRAHHEGYCATAPSGVSGYYWAWHAEKTVAALREAGHRLVPDPPLALVEPPPLCGPFTLSEKDGREILDADGSVAVRTACKRNSEAVLKLLDLAYRTGTLKRLTAADAGSA